MAKLKKIFHTAMAKRDEVWKHQIIRSKDDLKCWLKTEKAKYSSELSPIGLLCLTEKDFIWHYQKRLRKTEYYLNSGKQFRYLVSRIKLMRMSAKTGINVRLNSYGKGLRIIHISSVITSGDIGENYTAFPNTLVGEGTRGGNPVIGNNVIAYTGATIVGNILIADRVKIGANAFVNKTIDECGVTVGGVPAKIISKSNTVEGVLKK